MVTFIPDDTIFKKFQISIWVSWKPVLELLLLNAGLRIIFNGKTYLSWNGLLDLLQRKTNEDEIRYPIIHLKGDDIEVTITHSNGYGWRNIVL